MTAKPPTHDPRSAAPVLFYVGPAVPEIPDTDLSANQLARIAFVRSGRHATSKDIAALADALAATGSYSKEPATPATPEDPS
jgi:hypothetical protein